MSDQPRETQQPEQTPAAAQREGMPHLAVASRGAASLLFADLFLCGSCHGVTKLTDVPQFAKPFLVPPQVPMVRVNWGGVQFGDWMYSLAK